MSITIPRLLRSLRALGPIALLAGCTTTAVPKPPAPPAAAPAPATTTPAATTTAPAPAEPLRNTIRWKTASEVENFGFDVYRATAEEGPFDRITASPVPGGGTVDEPRSYEYTDESIESGVAYWYYVESISMQGAREKFTPTFKAKVKTRGPAPAPSPAPAPH